MDQHGNRVFEYDDAHSALIPLVVVSISPWNDPRCPLFCAAIDPSPSNVVSSTFRTRGVVTFSNVVMTLPAHTPVSTKVYRSSVQTVRLIAESKCMVWLMHGRCRRCGLNLPSMLCVSHVLFHCFRVLLLWPMVWTESNVFHFSFGVLFFFISFRCESWWCDSGEPTLFSIDVEFNFFGRRVPVG